MNHYSVQPKPVGITMNAVKCAAVIAMTIDHIAFAFVPFGTPLYILMRFIGRLTAPIMFFAAVEGFRYTHNVNRYMFRLAVFALVSWVPYLYFFYGGDLTAGSPFRPSVIFTIFLGVAAIRVRRSHAIHSTELKIVLITGLVLLAIPADWGVTGVLIILAMDCLRACFSLQMTVYAIIVLFGLNVMELVSQPILSLAHQGEVLINPESWLMAFINAGAFLPIGLLSCYKGQHGRKTWLSKWFFYIYYPAHLIVLGFLQRIL